MIKKINNHENVQNIMKHIKIITIIAKKIIINSIIFNFTFSCFLYQYGQFKVQASTCTRKNFYITLFKVLMLKIKQLIFGGKNEI